MVAKFSAAGQSFTLFNEYAPVDHRARDSLYTTLAKLPERDIFYKACGANFSQTAVYVIASLLAQLPHALVESVLFTSLMCWAIGFAANTSN